MSRELCVISKALLQLLRLKRDIAVSALREWIAGLGLRNAVKVYAIGKLKTIFQMASKFGIVIPIWIL